MKRNKLYKEFKIKNVQDYKNNKCYYRNSSKNKKKTKFNIDKALANKLDREFKEFCKSLMKKDKSEILDRAYEITVKDELKEEIKNMNLYEEEKEMMFLQEDLLNEFYHDWLDCDTPLGDSLKECLEESVATLTRYMGKKKNIVINKNDFINKER